MRWRKSLKIGKVKRLSLANMVGSELHLLFVVKYLKLKTSYFNFILYSLKSYNMYGVVNVVVVMMENIVFIANGFSFVKYFMGSMHYSPATAASMVTNFMGTSFLLTLFGGFIADSFLTRFTTFIIFSCIELMVILIFIQIVYI